MSMRQSPYEPRSIGAEDLMRLPAVVADGFENWTGSTHEPPPQRSSGCRSGFASEREYRFCKAVVSHPLRPSSAYPRLAGLSPKTAQPIRRRLVSLQFIREQPLDVGSRGRTALLLEPLAAGIAAVTGYEARSRS